MLLIRGVLASAVAAALALTWVDPDLWGHLRFGLDIIDAGRLHDRDPYSFTSDVRWVNHEWLAETLIAAAFLAGGSTGLILLKLLIVLATVVVVMRGVWRSGSDATIQDVLLVVLSAGIWIRVYIVRPQIFSLLCFAILLSVLRAVESGHTRRLAWLPLVFCLWVSLHGGWIVGAGVLVLWAVISAATSKQIPRIPLVIGVVASAAATLVNPYGTGMWAFLAETVRPARPFIDDWRPLYTTPALLPFWIPVATAAIAGLWRERRTMPWSHTAIVVALGIASVRVTRLDAFFAIATVAILGPRLAAIRSLRFPAMSPSRRAQAVAVAVAAAVLMAIAAATPTFRCIGMEKLEWLPERDVVPAIQAGRLRGRMITWFGWGQYALWHLAPDIQVSFDGRRETVYSEAFGNNHIRLYWVPNETSEFLRSLDADFAWVPKDLPLGAFLEGQGWARIFEGSRSVVFSRQPHSPLNAVAIAAGERCFPGP